MTLSDTQVVVATIIVCMVVVILYTYVFRDDKSRREKYTKLYESSAGTFDVEAQSALKTIEKIKNPTAVDSFTRGNILELNVAQGEPVTGGRNLVLGVADAYANTLHQIRHQALTARVLTAPPTQQVNPQTNTHTNTHAEPAQRPEPHPIFMLDHIENFADRNLQEIAEDLMWQDLLEPLANIANDAADTRTQLTSNTAADVASVAKTKKEFTEKMVPLLVTNTSDSQNVHDSSVRLDNQNTLNVIRGSQSKIPVEAVLGEIRTFIQGAPADQISESKKLAAGLALNEFSKSTFVTAYNARDSEILKQVWDRAHIPENSANSTNIKLAVVEALAACIVDGKSVCVNGRVSNVIGALATLDANSTVGAALTSEQYKNEILRTCLQEFDKHINDAVVSTDPEMRKVGLSYSDSNVKPVVAAEEEFKRSLSKSIDAIVSSYKGKVTDTQLANIRNDCYTACAI